VTSKQIGTTGDSRGCTTSRLKTMPLTCGDAGGQAGLGDKGGAAQPPAPFLFIMVIVLSMIQAFSR